MYWKHGLQHLNILENLNLVMINWRTMVFDVPERAPTSRGDGALKFFHTNTEGTNWAVNILGATELN